MSGLSRSRHGGSALIELVVVTPVLLSLMLGLFDLGNLLQQKIWLEQAVRAGGIIALGQPQNQSAIKAAVVAASWNAVTSSVLLPTCYDINLDLDASCGAYIYETIEATSAFSPLLLPITSISASLYIQVR